MSDVLTPQQRSYCMSRIQGRDTKPELLLRQILWGLGLRYRLKSKILGRPDLVFPSARVVVFVDGCQWHCCPEHFVRPKSNQAFWDAKFEKNRRRDIAVNDGLRIEGWRVIRLWEHEIERAAMDVALRIHEAVRQGR